MAEVSATRVVAVAAIVAAALVGGAVATGVASVAGASNHDNAGSSPDGGSVGTAAVVRTNLSATVQVGGSIGYEGSYAIAAPSGSSAQAVLQAQEMVTEDQQALSGDQQIQSGAEAGDDQTTAADQSGVTTASAALDADKAAKTRDCGGGRGASAACTQDAQQVSQDQTQLTQAEQQLATAQSTATVDRDQNRAKVQSDRAKLRGDQATLASLQALAASPGTTYTWLPKVGAIIKQDRPVYSVSNEPVPLLYGSIAAYRAFYVGMSDGADVGQLTRDLVALGYGDGLSQSNHYSAATASAVERWQRALGLPVSGKILLGQVVFEPGPIRVTAVTPSAGSSVGGGGGGGTGAAGGGAGATVLTATGTTPIVTVDLDVTQEYLVRPGDTVSVVLPSGTSTVRGRIESVGNVATCPGGGGTGLGNASGASTADQSPCESSGAGTSSTPTVTVNIRLQRTPRGAALDQAPVNVNITSQTADHVLAVPVNALLALRGGGFGVDVVTGNSSRLVGVTTGLYSDTLVQVSGLGIAAGMRVQVPSS